jgi:hypothetical protein
MDRSTPSEKRYDYRELVELITQGIPTFEPLHKFLLDANDNLPCEITLLEFEESQGHEPQVSEGRQETTKKIKSQNIDPKCQEELLVNVLQRTDGHQLLLVENLTPTVTSLLGTYWNVPPDFFLAHLENSNWYNMQNIPQNLPGLSSVQSLDGFVRFQFIGPREIEIKDSPGLQPRGNITRTHVL